MLHRPLSGEGAEPFLSGSLGLRFRVQGLGLIAFDIMGFEGFRV